MNIGWIGDISEKGLSWIFGKIGKRISNLVVLVPFLWKVQVIFFQAYKVFRNFENLKFLHDFTWMFRNPVLLLPLLYDDVNSAKVALVGPHQISHKTRADFKPSFAISHAAHLLRPQFAAEGARFRKTATNLHFCSLGRWAWPYLDSLCASDPSSPQLRTHVTAASSDNNASCRR